MAVLIRLVGRRSITASHSPPRIARTHGCGRSPTKRCSKANGESRVRKRRGSMDNNQPFTIESPTRVRLGPEALWWAEQYFGPGGKGREAFARHLLAQHQLQQAGLVQRNGES